MRSEEGEWEGTYRADCPTPGGVEAAGGRLSGTHPTSRRSTGSRGRAEGLRSVPSSPSRSREGRPHRTPRAARSARPGEGFSRKGGESMEGLPLTSLISMVVVLVIVMLAVYLAVKK